MIKGPHPRTEFWTWNGKIFDDCDQVTHCMCALKGSFTTTKCTQKMLVEPECLHKSTQ
jgi:hypothetical protein